MKHEDTPDIDAIKNAQNFSELIQALKNRSDNAPYMQPITFHEIGEALVDTERKSTSTDSTFRAVGANLTRNRGPVSVDALFCLADLFNIKESKELVDCDGFNLAQQFFLLGLEKMGSQNKNRLLANDYAGQEAVLARAVKEGFLTPSERDAISEKLNHTAKDAEYMGCPESAVAAQSVSQDEAGIGVQEGARKRVP